MFEETDRAARTIWSPRAKEPGPRKDLASRTTSVATAAAIWWTLSFPTWALSTSRKWA